MHSFEVSLGYESVDRTIFFNIRFIENVLQSTLSYPNKTSKECIQFLNIVDSWFIVALTIMKNISTTPLLQLQILIGTSQKLRKMYTPNTHMHDRSLSCGNISAILWWSVLLFERWEKIIDLQIVTDKCYHIKLYRVHLALSAKL